MVHKILDYNTSSGVKKFEGHKTDFYDKAKVGFYDAKLKKIIE